MFQTRCWDGDFVIARRLLGEQALGTVHRFESRSELWQPDVSPGWRDASVPEDTGGLL